MNPNNDNIRHPNCQSDICTAAVTDSLFANVVKTRLVDAANGDNITVSIDLNGLAFNTIITSLDGETKSLPKGNELSEVKLAFCSCSNYLAGLFNVYGAMVVSNFPRKLVRKLS